ncbi:MAG: FAD-binding oxidoreductase [Acidobacteriota bacterium]
MAPVADTVRTQLAAILTESQLTEEAAPREAFGVDGKVPDFVAYPGTAEQVALALKCAAEHNLAVIACGGATSLGIGNIPRRYDIALSMRNITKVRYYEPSDLTAGIGAGVKLEHFQSLLHQEGLWLPLDPPGSGQATLGGVVATNASGPLRQFYGAPRDMVVGMQIATTEGKLIKTGGRVVKNVAGYDLGKVLIGSYGTLGIITEVNLKLYPLPAERQTFVLSAGTLGIARDLRRSILNSPIDPMRFVLMDAESAGIVRSVAKLDPASHEPEIWLEAGGSKSVIERILKELDGLGRAVGAKVQTLDREGAQEAWKTVSDFSNGLKESYPGAVVLKGTMPVANSEEFLSLAQQEAQNEEVRMASVTQSGVGILYLGLLDSQNASQTAGLITRIRKAAEKAGGAVVVISASAEVKAHVDVWGMPETGFELMRKMKAAWDPKGVLAPGRFVGSL